MKKDFIGSIKSAVDIIADSLKEHKIEIVDKKFCTKCGKKLKITKTHEGYDEYTGKKIYAQYLHCPEVRQYGLWKSWKFGSHTFENTFKKLN